MKTGRFFFYVFSFFLLSACGSGNKNYIADFDLKDIGNSPVYAVHKFYDGTIRIDTAWPKNNFFRVRGEADSLSRVDLYTSQYRRMVSLYLKNGDQIEIKGSANQYKSLKIKNDDINNDIADFNRKHAAAIKMRDSLQQQLSFIAPEKTNERSSWRFKADSLQAALSQATLEYAEKNRRSPAAVALIAQNMLSPASIALCDSAMKILSPKAKQGNPIARREIEAFLKDSHKLLSKTFIPFKLKNEKDTLVQIDSLQGKPTILHFWSAQRTQKNPDNVWLNEATFYYPDTAVNVISIAFDIDTATWKKSLRDNPYTGIKLVEPKGFSSNIANDYGILKLPDNIVIDRSGKIVGRDLKSFEIAALLKLMFDTTAKKDSLSD